MCIRILFTIRVQGKADTTISSPFLSPLEFLCLETPSQMSRYEMAAPGAKRTFANYRRRLSAKVGLHRYCRFWRRADFGQTGNVSYVPSTDILNYSIT
jgi:hypothetical protein